MADETESGPFSGFVTHEAGANVLHAEDAAPADDNGNEDSNNEEDQSNEDSADYEGTGEEGANDGDDELDGDEDGDDDAGDVEEDAEEDDDTGGDAEEDDSPPPEKKQKRSPQHRINKAVKHQRVAERRAEAAEARAEAAEARAAEFQKGLTPDEEDGTGGGEDSSSELQKPDVTDGEKYPYGELDSKYQEDLTEYRVDKKLAERDQKRETEENKISADKEAQEWQSKYDSKIVDGVEAYDDFDEVVVKGSENNEFPLTPETAMMALASEVGHHVIYEIATNSELADKMSKMTAIQQAQQFGRLEARFSKTSKPKSKNVPNTAPPPTRRKGGGGVKKFDATSASFADFENHVNAGNKRRKRK